LTPGDVFVFRLADIDGDGFWEIDQSLDSKNFRYTGMLTNCRPEGGTGIAKNECMDQDSMLIPNVTSTRPAPRNGGITPGLIVHHRNVGYVEFIGEGVFDNMSHELLNAFISEPPLIFQPVILSNELGPHKLAPYGQRKVGNGLGTTLWSWVDPLNDNDFGPFVDVYSANTASARTASDVPNALSGTAFITPTGKSHGIAYNAEAIVNFRTNSFPHRASNYTVPGVILHHENPAIKAANHLYVYGYSEAGGGALQDNAFESRISFNNTWGPTLADGDDYGAANPQTTSSNGVIADLSHLTFMGGGNEDAFDITFGNNNSVTEVEEAVRKATYYGSAVNADTVPNESSPSQLFTGFYFDNAVFDKSSNENGTVCQGQSNGRVPPESCQDVKLQSYYFAFFPTKFFYAESGVLWGPLVSPGIGRNSTNKLLGDGGYLEAAVEHALGLSKPFKVQVWDTTEQTPGVECLHSPCSPPEVDLQLSQELSIFNIKALKDLFGSGSAAHQNWTNGRVVLQVYPEANVCRANLSQAPLCINTFPGLMYTFEMGTDGYFSHWRSLER
jgi:hypothetical protein